jgi:hypothetical protein
MKPAPIDMRMTWAHCVPIIVAALQDGTPKGKVAAVEQLSNMARAADAAVDLAAAARKARKRLGGTNIMGQKLDAPLVAEIDAALQKVARGA